MVGDPVVTNTGVKNCRKGNKNILKTYKKSISFFHTLTIDNYIVQTW